MKRLSTGLLAAMVAVGIGTTSVSASNSAQAIGNVGPDAPTQTGEAPAGEPPAYFGTTFSGETERVATAARGRMLAHSGATIAYDLGAIRTRSNAVDPSRIRTVIDRTEGGPHSMPTLITQDEVQNGSPALHFTTFAIPKEAR